MHPPDIQATIFSNQFQDLIGSSACTTLLKGHELAIPLNPRKLNDEPRKANIRSKCAPHGTAISREDHQHISTVDGGINSPPIVMIHAREMVGPQIYIWLRIVTGQTLLQHKALCDDLVLVDGSLGEYSSSRKHVSSATTPLSLARVARRSRIQDNSRHPQVG